MCNCDINNKQVDTDVQAAKVFVVFIEVTMIFSSSDGGVRRIHHKVPTHLQAVESTAGEVIHRAILTIQEPIEPLLALPWERKVGCHPIDGHSANLRRQRYVTKSKQFCATFNNICHNHTINNGQGEVFTAS